LTKLVLVAVVNKADTDTQPRFVCEVIFILDVYGVSNGFEQSTYICISINNRIGHAIGEN